MSDYKDKQRINEYLHSYWDSKRQSQACPTESQIEPQELAEIWDSCFLVRYNVGHDEDSAFTYLYLGTALLEAYGGDDASARDICTRLIFPSSMSLVHKFKEIIKTGKPTEEESEFLNIKKLLVKYRSTMLPLTDEKGQVRYILGGMKWKAF
jgi:hypothetical protein